MLIGSDGIGYTLGKHRISISFNHFLEIPHLAFGIYRENGDDIGMILGYFPLDMFKSFRKFICGVCKKYARYSGIIV